MICELCLNIKVGRDSNLLQSPLCRAAATAVTKLYLEITKPTINLVAQ